MYVIFGEVTILYPFDGTSLRFSCLNQCAFFLFNNNPEVFMKLLSFFMMALVLFTFSPAQTKAKKKQSSEVMKGYLVDKMCGTNMEKKDAEKAMQMAAKHTKMCATEEACAASGYGLMMSGKWTPFDAAGSKKAAEYLKNTKAKDHIFIAVNGKLDEDKITVSSIKAAKEKKD
jgi:hypothetical protein